METQTKQRPCEGARRRRTWRRAAALATLLATTFLALTLGSCGGSGATAVSETEAKSTEHVAGPVLEFEADPGGRLAYTTSRIYTRAGEKTIVFENPQSIPHDVEFEAADGKIVAETPRAVSSSTTIPVTFTPGIYRYFSTVPGDRRAGLEGTLVVKP